MAGKAPNPRPFFTFCCEKTAETVITKLIANTNFFIKLLIYKRVDTFFV